MQKIDKMCINFLLIYDPGMAQEKKTTKQQLCFWIEQKYLAF